MKQTYVFFAILIAISFLLASCSTSNLVLKVNPHIAYRTTNAPAANIGAVGIIDRRPLSSNYFSPYAKVSQCYNLSDGLELGDVEFVSFEEIEKKFLSDIKGDFVTTSGAPLTLSGSAGAAYDNKTTLKVYGLLSYPKTIIDNLNQDCITYLSRSKETRIITQAVIAMEYKSEQQLKTNATLSVALEPSKAIRGVTYKLSADGKVSFLSSKNAVIAEGTIIGYVLSIPCWENGKIIHLEYDLPGKDEKCTIGKNIGS